MTTEKAKVVICGAGTTGSFVAYHLAKLGWGADTVLLETMKEWSWPYDDFEKINNFGSTSKAYSNLCRITRDVLDTSKFKWTKCGSLNLARTNDRMTVFRRLKACSALWNLDCKLLTQEEIKNLYPSIKLDDLKGGLWIANDGFVFNSSYLLKEGIRESYYCPVKQILTHNGRVQAVETAKGTIECDYFVNCAGILARKIGQLSKPVVNVPILPADHYYLDIKPDGFDIDKPGILRDQDGYIYFIKDNNYGKEFLAGGYEPDAVPSMNLNNVLDQNGYFRITNVDWDHFHTLFKEMLYRDPTLSSAKPQALYKSMKPFSPDGRPIVGESAEIKNYFIAEAVESSVAGGIGKVVADWIVHGAPLDDVHEFDINRFLRLHNNLKFLYDRVKEVPGLHYAIPYPLNEFKSGRHLRLSPIYPKLKEAGAVFGQVMGYERPSWFECEYAAECLKSGEEIPFRIAHTNTFYKPNWFENVKNEYTACREAVGLIDYSSYTKYDLWSSGREVVDFLQYMCSNDVDVPVNSIIHTGLQNEQGGYENDSSLIRMSENQYMMVSPTVQQARCRRWLEKHLNNFGSVNLTDITSMYTGICVIGPFSRKLLSELTETDLSPKSFPFFTYKELDVGLANGVRTMNITHTGELGYVLYIPNEFALHVYNCLLDAGRKYGIRHVGHFAVKSLRVERFFAFWGQDLDTSTTPLECGRAWRVKFDKGIDFIGKEALLRQKKEGVKRLYVQLMLNDHNADVDPWCWGTEPIYRNSECVGAVTTPSYGFTFEKQIALGFVQKMKNGEPEFIDNDYVLDGRYEVDIAGIRYPAKVNLHSPLMPTKYPDVERESYFATRNKMASEPLLRK